MVDKRQQDKSKTQVETYNNSAEGGQYDSDGEPDWMRNAVINKDIDGEEKKSKKKDKFGIGSRRADKRKNHANCRDLFSRRVEEESCTKKEGKNLHSGNTECRYYILLFCL